ncbi:hypothetical protein CYY_004880 [Polysphondylium violaceum]|uniref:GH16 domain-containing protein n=1 Tax=Polysphondylium violaceum TaxID=133409 RepID=A0A8J4PUF1_9MYCE|nr:hypothetical protein CYY_004880 [Polysphondylium violaceum]
MGRYKSKIIYLLLILLLSSSTVFSQSSSSEEEDSVSYDSEGESESGSDSHQVVVPCATSFSDPLTDTPTNFKQLLTTSTNNPYPQCSLNSNNVNFDNSDSRTVMRLAVDAAGCPTDCNKLKYSCARVNSISSELSFGSYSCIMRVAKSSSVINVCSIQNGGIGDGASEVYMKYQYPYFTLGYITFGKQKTVIDPIRKDIDINGYHNFTISYRNTSVTWFLNGLELTQRGGSIPVPPMSFYAALIPDPTKDYNASLVAEALVDTLSYQSRCDQIYKYDDYSLRSIPPYYRENCTTSREVNIFNDTLDEDWRYLCDSYTAVPDNTTAEFQRHGTGVMAFEIQQESKPFNLLSKKYILIRQHKYITFWINGGVDGNQDIKLELYNTKYSTRGSIASVSLSTFLKGGLKPRTWNKVIISMREFQVNPSNITTFNAFSFRGGHDEYMGVVYIDDMKFANSTACINDKVAYYKNGELQNGADKTYSAGAVRFNSKDTPYRDVFKKPGNSTDTISFPIISSTSLNLNFQNGTIKANEYYAFQISFYYTQTSSYGKSSSESDLDIPPLSLQVCIQIGDVFPPCIGLSEYMGGKFPSGVWVKLTIPFGDLSAWDDAEISSLIMKTSENNYQGKMAIGSIEVGKRADPPIRSDLESIAVKTLPFNFTLVLSLSLLLFLIL